MSHAEYLDKMKQCIKHFTFPDIGPKYLKLKEENPRLDAENKQLKTENEALKMKIEKT